MSALSRLKASPGLLVRALVALGAVAAIAAGLAAFASRRAPLGSDLAQEIVVLVVVGALTRRYGIALPGNGFSSFILGVTAYAILDRGWAFGILLAPLAMLAGDLALRRLPVAAALDHAAHRLLGGSGTRVPRARARGARHGRIPRDRRRNRGRRSRERVGDSARRTRRRARAHSGLVAGDRAGH